MPGGVPMLGKDIKINAYIRVVRVSKNGIYYRI